MCSPACGLDIYLLSRFNQREISIPEVPKHLMCQEDGALIAGIADDL